MSVQRIFECDGPECGVKVTTHAEHPPTFITVFEEPGFPHESRHETHYCNWDCLMKAAATVEPPVIIPFDGADSEPA